MLTAPLSDFITKPKGEQLKFKSKIRFDGKSLRVGLPAVFKGQRFEAYYSQGQLIVARAAGKEDGCKCGEMGHPDRPYYCVQFGKKWAGDMTVCRFVADVTFENDQFIVTVPEGAPPVSRRPSPGVPVTVPAPVTVQKVEKSPREKALGCIQFLNRFAAQNDFAFEVVDGKISLIKSDRIG